jgi:hypothetical protein
MTHSKPWVQVTLQGPEDGGDFGPLTPGTCTSDIQEAIDCAHAHCRDVYIWGGRGGLHQGQGLPGNIYALDEPLQIPWSQDFHLDGGNAIFAYRSERGHAIHIDSQMNCRYKFGLITSAAPNPVVCLRPETPGPDDFSVITASFFDFSAVCSAHPEGTSILLDARSGPIVNSLLRAEEFNARGTGLHLSDAGGEGHFISNNQIQILYGNQYHAGDTCTGLRLGDPGTSKILHNRIDLSLHAPRSAYFDAESKEYATVDGFVPGHAVGAQIFAQRNALKLAFYGPRAPGHDIVFESEARDNTIDALNLPNGVTNNATLPTNRIAPNWPVGFAVPTPDVPPSNNWAVNDTSYAVEVFIVDPGEVAQWELADAGSIPQDHPRNLSLVDNLRHAPPAPAPPRAPEVLRLESGLNTGQTFSLAPGDRVRFTYTRPPIWRWKALP